MAVARSSPGGVALRYVLPVLWMTSRLAVMGATPKGGPWWLTCATTAMNGMAIPGRSLMSMNACCLCDGQIHKCWWKRLKRVCCMDTLCYRLAVPLCESCGTSCAVH